MLHRLRVVALPALVLCALAASAETAVTCATGCIPTPACEGDASPNLLCLPDRNSDVTLEWRLNRQLKKKETIRVYAGNPLAGASIPERQVTFTQQQDGPLTGSYTLRGDQLGKGPLLVVTTLSNGKDESLLSWIPFRTATPEETRTRLADSPPASEWAVDVVPSFMQVSVGARELPRTQDSTRLTWHSLAGMQLPIADADLDGPTTGAAGLGIQATEPWHAVDDWKSQILQRLHLPSEHSVEVDQLKWNEMPDRKAQINGVTVSLRNYYTVVTLFTNATVTNYSGKDLDRSSSKRYFAHETSAMLEPLNHPLLWSSYTQSDYGSDRGLLKLLQREVATNSGELSLGPLQQIGGDGGPAVYRVAFTVRVRPWSDDDVTRAMSNRTAGIIGMDIVALRTGIGEVRVPAGKDTKGVTLEDCGVWKCEPGSAPVNMHDPPAHTDIDSWQVSAATPTGQAPMIPEIASIGQRGPEAAEPSIPERFPPLARFAVGANLRAGALLQRGGWFDNRVDGVIPINTYAQFVVRIAVVTFPQVELTTTDTVIHTSPKDLQVDIGPTKPGRFSKLVRDWIRDHFGLSMALMALFGIGALILLCVVIPGCQLVAAILSFFTAILNRITQWIRPKR